MSQWKLEESSFVSLLIDSGDFRVSNGENRWHFLSTPHGARFVQIFLGTSIELPLYVIEMHTDITRSFNSNEPEGLKVLVFLLSFLFKLNVNPRLCHKSGHHSEFPKYNRPLCVCSAFNVKQRNCTPKVTTQSHIQTLNITYTQKSKGCETKYMNTHIIKQISINLDT